MHLFFVLELFDIRSPKSSENIPVDVPQIIARDVVSKVREVRTASAFARQMLTACSIGQSTIGPQPHPLNLIER